MATGKWSIVLAIAATILQVRADTSTYRLGFVGDSWTAGYFLKDRSLSFPNIVKKRAQEIDARISSHATFEVSLVDGSPGMTSFIAVKRLEIVLKNHPELDWIVLEIGGNDALDPASSGVNAAFDPSRLESNLREAIVLTTEKYGKVLYIAKLKATQPVKEKIEGTGSASVAIEFGAVFENLCRGLSVYKNTYCLESFMDGLQSQDYLPDGIHPNKSGHERIAENILKDLSTLHANKIDEIMQSFAD